MTIKDIARESGYSIGTVSRVLNNHEDVSEKARRVITEIVEKNHFTLNNNAKLLKQQIQNTIAVIVKGNNNMLFTSLVEIIQKKITKSGYIFLLYYIKEDDNEVKYAIQVCRDRQPRGIIFLGSNETYFKEYFKHITIPCIMVTTSAKALKFDNLSSICIDDLKAAYMAIEHLYELGHRDIAVIGGYTKNSYAAKERYKGCEKIFLEKNIRFNEDKSYQRAYFDIKSGYKAMNTILDRMDSLSAVFAMSDVMALGAIRAICDRGYKVPLDISVMGVDGIELGEYMTPRLSTIKQPVKKLADRSVDILLECIKDKKPAVHEQIAFELVEGESTIKIC